MGEAYLYITCLFKFFLADNQENRDDVCEPPSLHRTPRPPLLNPVQIRPASDTANSDAMEGNGNQTCSSSDGRFSHYRGADNQEKSEGKAYGTGMAKEAGAIDRMGAWPEHVQQRIHDTYLYFGGGLGITAASAAACFRSPTVMNLVTKNGFMAIAGTIALLIGSGAVVRSIEYRPGFGAKQLAWMAHAGIVGAVIAPLAFLGGPLLVRAACYTGGVVGGLSTVALCAPSDRFLHWGGALGMGLGVVFVSSIASSFLPPTTALGAGLASISVYGGLVLFGGFLLYDTQRIVKAAETHPYYAVSPYDPVNHSIAIYMDTINIFIRIAMLLSASKRK